MKSLQAFFQYAYLFVGIFFGYNVYKEYQSTGAINWAFVLLAITAIGMFFFKRHFRKKFENRNQ
ncbi:hypothetical protein [Aquimarina agarivorans]|uniref:hypothetical protein n=1 Tax=Aquimarina agarivorans TaxID=980584 RepID=UPI000248FB1F|nr:hypothetical protein [Aquimarina agarivorans]